MQENPVLALVCGFNLARPLPHRTTFNRFFIKLAKHQGFVDECLSEVATKLYEAIRDFGKVVAIEATPIHSHSRPNKKPVSDPGASFVHKGGAQGKYKWGFGYYLHAAIDAELESFLVGQLSFCDEREKAIALPLLKKGRDKVPWFRREVVIADAGYDGYHVYEDIAR